jgi:hypothetical protein
MDHEVEGVELAIGAAVERARRGGCCQLPEGVASRSFAGMGCRARRRTGQLAGEHEYAVHERG